MVGLYSTVRRVPGRGASGSALKGSAASGTHEDPLLASVITGNTRIDGTSVVDWLSDDRPRSKRKACFLNLLACMCAMPTEQQPLIGFLEDIFLVDVDRIYARVDPELLILQQEHDEGHESPFREDRGPLHGTHLKLLLRITDEDQDVSSKYIIKTFRQDAKPSMQISLAIPPDDKPGRGMYADIDLDLGNPKRDVAGFLVHLGELMAEGKTNHLKLNGKLKKNPAISRHLHYDIV